MPPRQGPARAAGHSKRSNTNVTGSGASGLPPISQLQPTPRGRKAPRPSLQASPRKNPPTKAAGRATTAGKRQWRPSVLRASLPSMEQRQQTVRDQATLALAHMCSVGRDTGDDDDNQDSWKRTGPITLDDDGVRLYSAFVATKEANLSAQKWLDPAELAEQFPDQVRDPSGSLNTLIRFSNLTTFLYHVLSSAPDEQQGGLAPRGATARLSEAASAWLKYVVPAEKGVDDGCLRILNMIIRQIFLAASSTSRGPAPDVAQIFTRPLSGYQKADNSTSQMPNERAAERLFATLQAGSASEAQSVSGDVHQLATRPGWRWDDMATECVNFVERLAENISAAETRTDDGYESDPAPSQANDQLRPLSSPGLEETVTTHAVVSTVESRMQTVDKSQSKDSYEPAPAAIDTQFRDNILAFQMLQGEDADDDEPEESANLDSPEKENVNPALATNVELFAQLQDSDDSSESQDSAPVAPDLSAGIALFQQLFTEDDSDESSQPSRSPAAGPQPATSKVHIAIGAGNRLEHRAGPQPKATQVFMRRFLESQPDAERLGFSEDDLSSDSISEKISRERTKAKHKLSPKRQTRAQESPSRSAVVPEIELPRAAAGDLSPRQRERRHPPLPDLSPEREFGGDGYMGVELDDHQMRLGGLADDDALRGDDRQSSLDLREDDEAPFGSQVLRLSRKDKGKARAIEPEDDDAVFKEDESSEDELAVRQNRLRSKRTRTSLLDRVLQPLPTQQAGTLATSAERREATQLARDAEHDQQLEDAAERKRRRREDDAKIFRKLKLDRSDEDDEVEAFLTAERPNQYRQGRNGQRGLRIPWSTTEEQFLMKALADLGPSWSQMIALYGSRGTSSRIFSQRNAVSLKDKAVNIKLSYLRSARPVPAFLQEVSISRTKLPKHMRDSPYIHEMALARATEDPDDDPVPEFP
ncbi:TTAGGG repeat binding factor [Microbotryomycetes sp. JL201]|nr:TTAGGG repeat binding factor [Microbotryomycetes sp. JL201]